MTDTATDSPAAQAAVTKIPFSKATAGWLYLFAPLVLVSLALSLIALVVAINADGTTASQDGADETTVSEDGEDTGSTASTTLDAELGEFFFNLTPPTIAGGTDVAVSMTNTGAIVHNLAVIDAGTDPSSGADITDDMILTQFDDLQAGDSLSGSLNLEPETYLVVCLIPGHLEAGMKASLTVAAG